jgi:hypothetical protein
MDDLLAVTVDCYAGYMGEQTPRVVHLGEQRIEVAEVLDQWLAPTHRYFKLLAKDGHTYIVRHDVVTKSWELTMFRRVGA